MMSSSSVRKPNIFVLMDDVLTPFSDSVKSALGRAPGFEHPSHLRSRSGLNGSFTLAEVYYELYLRKDKEILSDDIPHFFRDMPFPDDNKQLWQFLVALKDLGLVEGLYVISGWKQGHMWTVEDKRCWVLQHLGEDAHRIELSRDELRLEKKQGDGGRGILIDGRTEGADNLQQEWEKKHYGNILISPNSNSNSNLDSDLNVVDSVGALFRSIADIFKKPLGDLGIEVKDRVLVNIQSQSQRQNQNQNHSEGTCSLSDTAPSVEFLKEVIQVQEKEKKEENQKDKGEQGQAANPNLKQPSKEKRASDPSFVAFSSLLWVHLDLLHRLHKYLQHLSNHSRKNNGKTGTSGPNSSPESSYMGQTHETKAQAELSAFEKTFPHHRALRWAVFEYLMDHGIVDGNSAPAMLWRFVDQGEDKDARFEYKYEYQPGLCCVDIAC